MPDGLVPSAPPQRDVRIDRQLPPQARKWGRVLDLSQCESGDLILTRPADPKTDHISRAITKAQVNGGFDLEHAQWTHAAVYLGDDEHLCEATFKTPGYRAGVIIRSLFEYCDGTYAIRARRPKSMAAKDRLRIAIGALTNLGSSYSVLQIIQFGTAALSGRGFWGGTQARGPRIKMRALVCSTLYQDAYNFAFRGNTVRMGSLCTPAHLSASPDFEEVDPQLSWLRIARVTVADPSVEIPEMALDATSGAMAGDPTTDFGF
jgi:hypothetical protein